MLRWDNSKPWIWAGVVVQLVSSPALLFLDHQSDLSSTATAKLPNAAASKMQGQLSYSPVFRASSPVPHPQPGSAGLYCPGKVQDLLSGGLQPVKGRDSSTFLMTSGPTDLPDLGEGDKASLPHSHCLKADDGWGQLSHTHILIHYPATWVSSTVLPWQGLSSLS